MVQLPKYFDATLIRPWPYYEDDQGVTITLGTGRFHQHWIDRNNFHWRELTELFLDCTVGPKDGPCYTPAIFSGTNRRKDQAVRIDLAVLDSDTGQTLEDIEAAVLARGWRAIIHSTHSHLTDRTLIAARLYDEWLQATPGGTVEQFMLAKKGYLPAVLEGAEIVDEVQDGAARYYAVRHQPCPKFRVLLPLAEPWRADVYQGQDMANAAWKERIGALAHALGLHHDQSCVDTSRLFYLPRVREEGAEFLFRVLDGDLCGLWTLPDAPQAGVPSSLFNAPAGSNGPSWPRAISADTSHKIGTDQQGECIDLTSWIRRNGTRFEVVKALRARCPEVLGDRKSGVKWHLECPNVDRHVTDQTTRTGTFAVNASDMPRAGLPSITSGFTIQCSHGGCASLDRLDHIAALLRRGCLSVSDLTDPKFLLADIPQLDASALLPLKEQDAAVLALHNEEGNIPSSLCANLPGVMGLMHNFVVATSPKPQPALALGAVLAFMGAALGRRVQLGTYRVRPNIYVVSIAHSGAGKDRQLSAMKQLAHAAGLLEKLIGVEEVASDAGIITSVFQQPNQVMLLDEISFLISSTKNARSGPHIQNVISVLLKLYSSSSGTYKSKSYADSDKVRIIDQPCVSLYGNSTPRGLFAALSSDDISSGLLSRMVLFNAGDHDPIGRAPGSMQPPQEVIDWLQAWDAVNPVQDPLHMVGGRLLVEPRAVPITAEAVEIIEAFEKEMHALKLKARRRGMDALYVRAGENAMKFALIRGCAAVVDVGEKGASVNWSALSVDADTMRWGCELSRCTIREMDRKAQEEIADNAFQVHIKQLRELIRNGGRKGVTLSEMRRTPAGRLPEKILEDVLRTLTESHDVFFIAKIQQGRGRPRDAYVHRKFVDPKIVEATEE